MQQTRFLLDQKDLPDHWYNVVADMPNPPAPCLESAGIEDSLSKAISSS
mgnify:CR=1 FL=1